jgi:hemerythrin-like domain-containing protein
VAVTLGAKPQAGFSEPIELLSDCHRRIEHFLDVIGRVVEQTGGGALDDSQHAALKTALRYFVEAAPRHTADEEQSLFPRMRIAAQSDERIREAMAKLDELEADHQAADELHAEVNQWCERWLEVGKLAPAQTKRLTTVLELLESLYGRHIHVEDHEVFPLAAQAMDQAVLRQVGQEMALRRGLQLVHNP